MELMTGANKMPTDAIKSKVSVPAGAQGKGVGLGGAETANDNPVKPGSAGAPVKGFSGGLINPKV